MEPERLLPCLQEPATGPYSVPDASSLRLATIYLRSTLILYSHLRQGLVNFQT
jgi:hypothetical protein